MKKNHKFRTFLCLFLSSWMFSLYCNLGKCAHVQKRASASVGSCEQRAKSVFLSSSREGLLLNIDWKKDGGESDSETLALACSDISRGRSECKHLPEWAKPLNLQFLSAKEISPLDAQRGHLGTWPRDCYTMLFPASLHQQIIQRD